MPTMNRKNGKIRSVGVHPFLDVSQIAALDDAVKPLGPADQHT